MNLRTLANFLRIAEAGSLKRAAEIINIAQPALTRQVALLEREFGAQLFLRHRRGVTLTDAGSQLRIHAERILGEVALAHDAVSASAREPSGSVSLGLPTSMRYVLSGSVVAAYVEAYPTVSLKVHEAIGHTIEELLRSRRVDLAILIAPAPMDNIDLTPLMIEDIYLAGPPEAGLDITTPVPVTYLAELPMIAFAPQNPVRALIETELAHHNLRLENNLEVEGQPLVLDLINRGAGYTMLPFCAVEAELAAGRISGAPIRGLSITWTLGVNRMRAPAPAIRELVDLIRLAIEDRISSGEWRVAPPA